MDPRIRQAISDAVKQEPFCQHLGMELIELAKGYSVIEADYRPELMDNLFRRVHGGALFALIDEAFETVAQSDGTIAVALNINVTYIASPEPGARLRAEARQISATRKTASYEIRVSDGAQLLATCQALAYRTGKPLPFL
jgi:acyl-CoA thioesterase